MLLLSLIILILEAFYTGSMISSPVFQERPIEAIENGARSVGDTEDISILHHDHGCMFPSNQDRIPPVISLGFKITQLTKSDHQIPLKYYMSLIYSSYLAEYVGNVLFPIITFLYSTNAHEM